MNCDKVKRILVDFSEGALGEAKRRAVEDHLSTCEACESELEQIERLKEDVLSLGSPECDTEFWRRFENKLSQRLEEEETNTSTLEFRRRAALPLAAAVAVAALAVVSLLMFGVLDFGLAPAPRVAEKATAGNDVDYEMSEMDVLSDDILSDTLLAQLDSSNSDMEEQAEDMFLLVEDDFRAVPDEMVLYDIYEPTLDDFLDDVSDEEFQDIYNGLASI